MTPANPDALADALAARISELEAENAQLAVERNEALAMRRWNIDRTDDGEVLVCRGCHDKGEDCDHERFVPEECFATAEARAAQLQAEVEALREALKPFAEYARLSDEAGLNIGPGEIGEFIHGGLRRSIHTRDLEAARTALAARAATAREGQTQTPASGALKIEEADRDA